MKNNKEHKKKTIGSGNFTMAGLDKITLSGFLSILIVAQLADN